MANLESQIKHRLNQGLSAIVTRMPTMIEIRQNDPPSLAGRVGVITFALVPITLIGVALLVNSVTIFNPLVMLLAIGMIVIGPLLIRSTLVAVQHYGCRISSGGITQLRKSILRRDDLQVPRQRIQALHVRPTAAERLSLSVYPNAIGHPVLGLCTADEMPSLATDVARLLETTWSVVAVEMPPTAQGQTVARELVGTAVKSQMRKLGNQPAQSREAARNEFQGAMGLGHIFQFYASRRMVVATECAASPAVEIPYDQVREFAIDCLGDGVQVLHRSPGDDPDYYTYDYCYEVAMITAGMPPARIARYTSSHRRPMPVSVAQANAEWTAGFYRRVLAGQFKN